MDKSIAILNQKKIFKLGEVEKYSDGNDVAIIATGSIIEEVVKASKILLKDGISCKILKCHTIKPININVLKKCLKNSKNLVTVEENNILGGLGGAISEICLENKFKINSFLRIGINDTYSSVVGDQAYLRKYYKIDSSNIVKRIKKFLTR